MKLIVDWQTDNTVCEDIDRDDDQPAEIETKLTSIVVKPWYW